MKSILLLAATALLFLIPEPAHACSCAYTTPATAYNDVAAVFIGKMVGSTETNIVTTRDGKEINLESGNVTFEVSKVYKGSIGKSVTISVASNKGTSCGTYGLVRNVEYIVWAYSWDKGSGKLSTGVCTRTRSVDGSSSKEDLDFLIGLPQKGSGGSIEGSVWLDTKESWGPGARRLAGISVSIKSIETGKVDIVTTNKDGKFELRGIPAGKYKLTPKVPKNYFVEEADREVEVNDLGTAATGFELYYDGHITGRILDKDGALFDFGAVGIDDGGLWMRGYSEGKDGKYRIEGVPPGKYRLFIEIEETANGKDKKYYYPGTYDVRKAKWLTVGLGKTVNAADFTLPSEFRVRTITGRVFNTDGSPAVDATVSLVCPKRDGKAIGVLDGSPSVVETDKNGDFYVQGFEGFHYWLGARLNSPDQNKRGVSYSLPQYIDAKVSGNKFDLLLTDASPVNVDCHSSFLLP